MQRIETFLSASILALVLSAPASAQLTQRVNVNSAEAQANGTSWYSSVSSDGRYVAFESIATNLVTGDTNGAEDIFVRDRLLGTTERVSVSSTGAQSNGSDFFAPFLTISANGRFVGFSTNATNLVPVDTNGHVDIFLRDRQLGTTELLSISSGGVQGNADARECAISGDGRYVAFRSYASNLVSGDANGFSDIFLRDRLAGTTVLVSVSSAGVQGNSTSQNPVISADGRYVAFLGYGDNLVAGDTNGFPDTFLRDMVLGTTTRISMGLGGTQSDGHMSPSSMSADGRYIAMEGTAGNLVGNDTNGTWDAFVFDRQTGSTERVSVATGGGQAIDGSYPIQYPSPSISADGRFVAFFSQSGDLVNNDGNLAMDVFVRDRDFGTTVRVSVDSETAEGNDNSLFPSISADGRYVTYCSVSNNLVGGDTNHDIDIFLHDLESAGFTSLCEPGVAGVMPCPCSNPPGGSGRGCNNSSATGGAVLSAVGASYLSADTLSFSTSGERPVALSILSQWNGANPGGAVFGMGVRCTSGTFKRLYTKVASGGSITAPDFGAGDPTVSARSAALGDAIQAGDSRWYFVYYRDPNVLGGCPATSTFNATQTGQVTWSL